MKPKSVWRGRAACVLGLVLLGAGCSSAPPDEQDGGPSSEELGIDDGASKGAETHAMAGPEQAATLSLQTGAELEIPAGALAADLSLSLERPSDEVALKLVKHLDANQKLASAPYVVTPHGTLFTKAVNVTLPMTAGSDVSRLKVVWLEDEEDTTWELLTTPTVVGNKASFTLNHFSVLALVEVEKDDLPPPPANSILIDGVEQNLTTGLLLDNGTTWIGDDSHADHTHHSYSIVLTDGAFPLERHPAGLDRGRPSGFSVLMDLRIKVPRRGAPVIGTYKIGEDLVEGYWGRWSDPAVERPDVYYTSAAGTVTVSMASGGYLVEFDLQLQNPQDASAPGVTLVGQYYFGHMSYKNGVEKGVVIGSPTFIVTPPNGLPNFHRFAWTGSRLWAATPYDWSDGYEQALVEIDPSTGRVLKTIRITDYESMIYNMNYANAALWDANEDPFIDAERRPLKRFDPNTGALLRPWEYTVGGRDDFYFWTHDGERYWTANGNHELVAYDESGAVVATLQTRGAPDDMVFGGGHFWASHSDGTIYKLDKDLDVVDAYHVIDYWMFGEARYAGEMPLHLEYIDGQLWIMDRNNGFYKTELR